MSHLYLFGLAAGIAVDTAPSGRPEAAMLQAIS
jgi:hypothetical protein